MSSDDASPPIGHNSPPESEEEHAELVEQVAIDLWRSRDPAPWEEAGDYWRSRFRELAATAIESVRQHGSDSDRVRYAPGGAWGTGSSEAEDGKS